MAISMAVLALPTNPTVKMGSGMSLSAYSMPGSSKTWADEDTVLKVAAAFYSGCTVQQLTADNAKQQVLELAAKMKHWFTDSTA